MQHQDGVSELVELLRALASMPIDEVAKTMPSYEKCGEWRKSLYRLVEGLYDFWREHHRFMILHSMPGPTSFDRRPYRAFNATVEQLTHLVGASTGMSAKTSPGTIPGSTVK